MIHCNILLKSITQKCVSSFSTSRTAVSLAFNSFGSSENRSHPPLVIAHGLFGHKSNWNSVSKQIQRKLDNQVFAIDFRNHGESPHTDSMTYSDMVEDLKVFINDVVVKESGYDSVHILGHSMGGKAVTLLAMDSEGQKLLRTAIIEDVSPVSESRNIHFKRYISQMKNVDLSKSRRKISDDLAHVITDLPTRQFFLTNLAKDENSNNRLRWKPNLDALENHIEHVLRFTIKEGTFAKPSLFITGANSSYVNESNHNEIKKMFPKVEFISIPKAGHWVHAENPNAFIDAIVNFLEKN
uniref:sn-1-specific diacylglycerol lipase ABHD11 n=1 Tax=Panagrolaimus superbus TaxID=310955 RepID=A0A914YYZ1_9BILA